MNQFSGKNSMIIINNTKIYHNKELVKLVKKIGLKDIEILLKIMIILNI